MSTLPYTKRGLQHLRNMEVLRTVYDDFRSWYMRERPDWNRMGPPLPVWFRRVLPHIDKRLVLQFIPPRSPENPRGTGPQWPHGAWYICARVRNTRWITRRAVFVLVEKDGSVLKPDRKLVALLKHAQRMRRQYRLDALEKLYEEQADRLMRENDDRERGKLLDRIVNTMRARNMVSRTAPRVFFPAPA